MCLAIKGLIKHESTTYGAPKEVRLPYPALKWIYIVLILGLLAAGIINLILQRGGQKVIPLIPTTLIKVKGFAAYRNGSLPTEIWDASDVVYPALENGATFLTTSFYRWEQRRSNCSGLLPCSAPSDCASSASAVDVGGLLTGYCNPDGFCEVISWCPVEEPEKVEPPSELEGIPDFTLFVRNFVGFPGANDGFDTGNDLTYNWNFFSVADLLKNASVDYNSIKSTGAVLVLSYDYQCNLDFQVADKCKNKAKTRVIQLGVGKDGAATAGFNFRKEDVYETYDSATDTRTFTRLLQKLYGIRIVVVVSGFAYKFDFRVMITNLGALFGSLSIAAIVVSVLMAVPIQKCRCCCCWQVWDSDKIKLYTEEVPTSGLSSVPMKAV